MKIRKLNRAIHRDLGYFFTGMIMVYALSGIALNHRHNWNPNYNITHRTLTLDVPAHFEQNEKASVQSLLDQVDESENYRKHYFPARDVVKIFLKQGGALETNLETGKTFYEKLRKRPVFFEVNFLHYNPGHLWTWFSDAFCVALILLGISGLFILKGKNGITRRGAWLTIGGVILPLILLFMYI
jgi:hypothetical protein